jgi:sulfite reductase alpha subunit-like flavoprotein
MINLENSFCTNLLILYGSQTGTAREVAYEIGRFGKRNSYDVCIYGLHEFSVEKLLRVKLALFVVSTAGQGQEPRNMTKFWKYLLRANLSKDYLSTLHFSVFGLGDSSYKWY